MESLTLSALSAMLADCSLQGLEREDLVSEDCPPVSPCLLCSEEGGVWD